MEPVFTVAQEPPVLPPQQQPHRLGLGETMPVQGGGWRRPARCALAVVLFLAVTGNFAFAAYRARHRSATSRSCSSPTSSSLEQLRRDPAARVAERRWLRIGVWGVSVALANTFASRVADAMPRLALKLVVWGVTAVILGLGFHFLLFSKDADRCCDGELGRGQADAGDRPATALHGQSPEEKV
ncbi:hypothetical protein C2845_PM07G36950 [Panicum miliaceum]|uniref:Uncharacterized protein n=1 Tax=Panicum miliaceum TaxID=4540 RepID=A0A3L6SQE0_PANMI|nr:hypothetical protein C2845_PM07G36950 [Panicum miliaceum]